LHSRPVLGHPKARVGSGTWRLKSSTAPS